jgi:hypothetical protein
MADHTPNVATPSAAVEKMRPEWELCEALIGGTRAMRAAGKKYLPKWPAEEQEAYDARLSVAVLFPAFARTVKTLTGKPFSKQVTLSDDMPPEVQEWMQDVDREGRNITSFSADLMGDALGPGLSGILVDYPVVERAPDAPPITIKEEKTLGLRPYWVRIKPGQILGWLVQRHGGAFKLTQLRLMESVEEPDGQYATKCVEQVRVLTPGAWETHRKNAKGEWVPHNSGVTTLDFVPFVPVYGERTAFLEAKPPLGDVAYLNVAHWQSASDQQNVLHVARVPILARIGNGTTVDANGVPRPNELKIGAGAAVDLPKDGDLKYVEHSGAAIDAGSKDLADLEERMRQAGAELLVIKPGEVTATATATENAVGMCALQRITLDLQDALNLALDYTAKMVKFPSAGTVKLFNDFGAMTLKEASGQLVLAMKTAGVISTETAINELKRRGELSADVDPEDEKEKVETEGPPLGSILPQPGGNNPAEA